MILREKTHRDYKSRIFIGLSSMNKPVHISYMYGKSLREVIFNKGIVEYHVDSKTIDSSNIEIYEIVYNSGSLYVDLYKVSESNELDHLGRMGKALYVSTGSDKVDKLIDEIVMYRKTWSSILCRIPNEPSEFYGAFLKADTALNYYLFKRLKDAWVELSGEYLGFIYALIHKILLGQGFKPVISLLDKCELISKASSISWFNTGIRYLKDNNSIEVLLEHRIGGSKPDLLLRRQDTSIAIECKQGPYKVWLNKAIKQSKKYRGYGFIPVLVTSEKIKNIDILSENYEYIVDQCNSQYEDYCTEMFSKILNGINIVN